LEDYNRTLEAKWQSERWVTSKNLHLQQEPRAQARSSVQPMPPTAKKAILASMTMTHPLNGILVAQVLKKL